MRRYSDRTWGARPLISSHRVRSLRCPVIGKVASCAPAIGSTFDLAGRVFKNKPAPDNLEVPPHMYLSETQAPDW